jgi:hypothetical protein
MIRFFKSACRPELGSYRKNAGQPRIELAIAPLPSAKETRIGKIGFVSQKFNVALETR